MTLADLKMAIDNHFCHPFLPKGTVKTWWTKGHEGDYLHIQIGHRDVELNKEGKVTGAGTLLCDQDEALPLE
uniref:Uncharacterized protein n=1 Tax=viral metagenome TaxID=1070528 RepID=A0A6M3Y0U1_9ZZZZ